MKKNIAAILGFLISPLFSAITLMPTEMLRNDHSFAFTDSIGWIPIIYCYILGATLVIGLPTYLIFRHFNKVTWLSAMFGGALCGAVMLFISNALNPIIIFIGALSGLIFWLIESRGR